MKLNHINLAVPDVPSMAAFLETYFEMRNGGGNAGFTVLYDDEGLVLSLMKAGRSWGDGYPGSFHIGFYLPTRERVDQVYQSLTAGGLVVDKPGDTGHSYGFYVTAPGGVQVEVGA